MRTIKFRVWDGEKMLYPYANEKKANHYMQFGDNGTFWLWDGNGENLVTNEKGVLIQFTGLHDRNGKEIYEGDILKGSIIKPYEVKWDHEYSGWNITSYEVREFEVIGNIHENPEMLKN